MVKEEQKAKENKTRIRNAKAKDKKMNRLMKKVDIIRIRRQKRAIENKERRAAVKRAERERKAKLEEIKRKNILEVYDKVKTKKHLKRQEEDRLAKELREYKLEQQFRAQGKLMVEFNQWKNQEFGAEREMQYRQNIALIHQEQHESNKYKERKLISKAAKKVVGDKVNFLKNYDKTYQEAYKANEILHREMRQEKQIQYSLQKQYEETHLKNMTLRDPYRTKITEESLKGTYINKNRKGRKRLLEKTAGFEDTLVGPRYDTIREEQPGQQEMVAIEIDDDFAKDIESDEEYD